MLGSIMLYQLKPVTTGIGFAFSSNSKKKFCVLKKSKALSKNVMKIYDNNDYKNSNNEQKRGIKAFFFSIGHENSSNFKQLFS
jgi:hypothetical protein